MKMRPEEMPDDDHELVIERVCAIDVAKASGKVCVAKLTGARVASSLTRRQLPAVLDAAAEVMRDVLHQGGTSFDSPYVNVNGEFCYFDRSLDAYGREGLPCRRCGAMIRREKFMNRSSFYCPRCQPRRRIREWVSRLPFQVLPGSAR